MVGIALLGLMILPCLIPIVRSSIQSAVDAATANSQQKVIKMLAQVQQPVYKPLTIYYDDSEVEECPK